jgi:PLP dependent protein
MIVENVAAIQRRISQAAQRAGRNAEDIRIVAAAKGQGREKILQAVAAGIRYVGHNYLQEAVKEDVSDAVPGLELHMIGHLQKNKANKALELFNMIETVDDAELASALHRRAEALGKSVKVLIQVNLSGEPQKSGISEQELPALVSAIRALSCLSVRGLMTMPPFFDDPERARPYFARLRVLRDNLMASGVFTREMGELSMGMTGDFEAAVEEGATLVRIGTALFGPR